MPTPLSTINCILSHLFHTMSDWKPKLLVVEKFKLSKDKGDVYCIGLRETCIIYSVEGTFGKIYYAKFNFFWQIVKLMQTNYYHLRAFCQEMKHINQHGQDQDDFCNIQGVFFNCSAPISILKRKTLFDQRGCFVHQEFHGTEYLIGCPAFFILVLKIGRNS